MGGGERDGNAPDTAYAMPIRALNFRAHIRSTAPQTGRPGKNKIKIARTLFLRNWRRASRTWARIKQYLFPAAVSKQNRMMVIMMMTLT
jgi:hypothetical protein